MLEDDSMMRILRNALLLTAAIALMPSLATANDFMSGRLYQIALEIAPDFGPAGEGSEGVIEAGGTQSFEQQLLAGTCYLWVAVGDGSGADIDLAVTIGGVEVAGDTALDDWPIGQYCSVTEQTARIDIISAGAASPFAFRSYAKQFGGADDIELNMNYFASVYAPTGVPIGPLNRANLAAGAEQAFQVQLEGNHCYTIIGSSGAAIVDLDFILEDAGGQVVGSDEAPDKYPVVGLCTPEAGNFNLRARVYAGGGDFGWQVFQEPIE